MNISGNELINIIDNDKVINKIIKKVNIDDINFNEIANNIVEYSNENKIFSIQIQVNNSLEIEIESNIINLPLKYSNILKKIIINDEPKPINIYVIIENENISKSKLKIKKIISIDSYIKNIDKYNNEIIAWLKEQNENII